MSEAPNNFNLTPERRDLHFKIIDNIDLIHWVAPRLYFLESGFPPDLLPKALKWLVANNITGKRFIEWFQTECDNSNLQMHTILLRVATNAEVTKVIAGRNFLT